MSKKKNKRAGRVIVITGNGKGKTTSALGTAIRASGQGFKILFLQFIKKKNANYGEHRFFYKSDSSPFLLESIGLGFKFGENKYEIEDIKAAQSWLDKVENFLFTISDNTKVLIVLDEVSYPMIYKWIKEEDLLNILKKYSKINFILTGREMPQSICDYADTISNIEEIKHAYQEGRNADIGIEF